MRSRVLRARLWLDHYGLFPRGKLAFFALYVLGLDLLLGGRPSFRTCLLAKVTASAINNVAPLRSGDVARLWMLERRAGIPKAAAAVCKSRVTISAPGFCGLMRSPIMVAVGTN